MGSSCIGLGYSQSGKVIAPLAGRLPDLKSFKFLYRHSVKVKCHPLVGSEWKPGEIKSCVQGCTAGEGHSPKSGERK